jgi:predicted transcriptional regulator
MNVSTDWTSLTPLIVEYSPDFVLVMAAEAGRSGGSFDFKTLEKIHKIRENFPGLRVHVDGGIDGLAAASLRGLGVELLVSGSYLHSGNVASEKVAYLQGVPDNPRLADLQQGHSPSVDWNDGWDDVIRSIEKGGIGCTAVLKDGKKYLGIITDHDIRVHISEGALPISSTARDLCNQNSFTAHPDEDFWTFMLRMQNNRAMHTVAPLVDEESNYFGIIRTQDVLFRKI